MTKQVEIAAFAVTSYSLSYALYMQFCSQCNSPPPLKMALSLEILIEIAQILNIYVEFYLHNFCQKL